MATPPTPTPSVPDAGKQSQPGRKPLSKAHRAKMARALAKWRASLTPEAKAELRERNRRTQQERWAAMSERERRDALAGVKAWQREQRRTSKATRDATRAKPEAPPKASPKPEAPEPASTKPARRSASRRTRKAVSS